jgi:hypothetical protein
VELLKCVRAQAQGAAEDPHVVLLEDSFEHVGPHGRHMCMVFEMLGANLLSLIKRYAPKKREKNPCAPRETTLGAVFVVVVASHAKLCMSVHALMGGSACGFVFQMSLAVSV